METEGDEKQKGRAEAYSVELMANPRVTAWTTLGDGEKDLRSTQRRAEARRRGMAEGMIVGGFRLGALGAIPRMGGWGN